MSIRLAKYMHTTSIVLSQVFQSQSNHVTSFPHEPLENERRTDHKTKIQEAKVGRNNTPKPKPMDVDFIACGKTLDANFFSTLPDGETMVTSRRPSQDISRPSTSTSHASHTEKDKTAAVEDVHDGRLSVFVHKRDDQSSHEVIQPLLRSVLRSLLASVE